MELWRRVNNIADLLGLGLWHLHIDERPDASGEDDEYAKVRVEHYEARITFYKPYYEADELMQLRVIVHELLHCVFAPLDQVIETLPNIVESFTESIQKIDTQDDAALKAVAAVMCTAIEENYEQRAEDVVDAIAAVVVFVNQHGLEKAG